MGAYFYTVLSFMLLIWGRWALAAIAYLAVIATRGFSIPRSNRLQLRVTVEVVAISD